MKNTKIPPHYVFFKSLESSEPTKGKPEISYIINFLLLYVRILKNKIIIRHPSAKLENVLRYIQSAFRTTSVFLIIMMGCFGYLLTTSHRIFPLENLEAPLRYGWGSQSNSRHIQVWLWWLMSSRPILQFTHKQMKLHMVYKPGASFFFFLKFPWYPTGTHCIAQEKKFKTTIGFSKM